MFSDMKHPFLQLRNDQCSTDGRQTDPALHLSKQTSLGWIGCKTSACLFSIGLLIGVGVTNLAPGQKAKHPEGITFSPLAFFSSSQDNFDAVNVIADKPHFLDLTAQVESVPLRFNNTCFYRKQKYFENQLMHSYASKLLFANKAFPQTNDVRLSFVQHCEQWVAQSTDATWHAIRQSDRAAAMDAYFAKDFESHVYSYSVGGHQVNKGRDALKKMVEAKLKTFPDLKIRILNTLCTPAVHDELGFLGFFTTMPDLSEGTMLGDMRVSLPASSNKTGGFLSLPRNTKEEIVLPATGKRVAYFGNAVTFVARDPETGLWQYQAEIVTHDEASMLAEIGENAWDALRPRGNAYGIVDKLVTDVKECSFPTPWYGKYPAHI